MYKLIIALFFFATVLSAGQDIWLCPKQEKETLLFGFVDYKGNWIIKPQYHMAGHFGYGLAYVKKFSKGMLINKQNEPVITEIILPPGAKYKSKIHFGYNFPFRGGMLIVQMNDYERVGAINLKGELVVPCKYAWLEGFCCGYSQARLPGEKEFFLINKKGEAVTKKYLSMTCVIDGYSIVKVNYGNTKKSGVLDVKMGKLIVPAFYEQCGFSDDSGKNKTFRVKRNGKWGIVDVTGKMLIPCMYERMSCFSFDLCAVKKNGKWFYINPAGKRITPIFDKAIYADFFMTNNLSIIYYGRKGPHAYIYRNGDFVFPKQIFLHYNGMNWQKGYIEVVVYKKMHFPVPLKILDNRRQNEVIKEYIRKNIHGLSDTTTSLIMLAEMCRKNNDIYRTLDMYNYIIKNEKLTPGQKKRIQAIINELDSMEKHRVNYHLE